MDQDRRGTGQYIVGVEAVDGEVVGGFGLVVGQDRGDLGGGAVCGLELVARVEIDGIDEGGLGEVVERVVVGRRQAGRVGRCSGCGSS